MAMIPVYVQQPCKPPGHEVGEAPDHVTAEEAARLVGVPEGCFLEGKIMRRKKNSTRDDLPPVRWGLIADVTFKVRSG